MLPCHTCPGLKKHPQLKSNFGTHGKTNKRNSNVPGAFLFTTNCIIPAKRKHKANIFTTDMVGFDSCAHVKEKKTDGTRDFSVIERAISRLGGLKETQNSLASMVV